MYVGSNVGEADGTGVGLPAKNVGSLVGSAVGLGEGTFVGC